MNKMTPETVFPLYIGERRIPVTTSFGELTFDTSHPIPERVGEEMCPYSKPEKRNCRRCEARTTFGCRDYTLIADRRRTMER